MPNNSSTRVSSRKSVPGGIVACRLVCIVKETGREAFSRQRDECPGPKSWTIFVKRWQLSGVSSAGSQERPLAFSQRSCDKVHPEEGNRGKVNFFGRFYPLL